MEVCDGIPPRTSSSYELTLRLHGSSGPTLCEIRVVDLLRLTLPANVSKLSSQIIAKCHKGVSLLDEFAQSKSTLFTQSKSALFMQSHLRLFPIWATISIISADAHSPSLRHQIYSCSIPLVSPDRYY